MKEIIKDIEKQILNKKDNPYNNFLMNKKILIIKMIINLKVILKKIKKEK